MNKEGPYCCYSAADLTLCPIDESHLLLKRRLTNHVWKKHPQEWPAWKEEQLNQQVARLNEKIEEDRQWYALQTQRQQKKQQQNWTAGPVTTTTADDDWDTNKTTTDWTGPVTTTADDDWDTNSCSSYLDFLKNKKT
ncbi:uncharacterized protein LOC132702443 [Cylas formicarius]|uniref:uncharacterized protein LOC132702443 n=1 Tax=Cylas formicarius TaxID=197179 RepID=UPI0029585471|nr:uncharacterized protein LOC132702443 [Cylas formicarius]